MSTGTGARLVHYGITTVTIMAIALLAEETAAVATEKLHYPKTFDKQKLPYDIANINSKHRAPKLKIRRVVRGTEYLKYYILLAMMFDGE